MTNLNLYGIPVRTWIRMNNISVVLGSGEAEQFLGTSQFSSQERNTEGDMGKMLNNVHDEFHTYLVLVIVILSAVVSAVIFVSIIFTLYSCCCSRSSATSNKRCHNEHGDHIEGKSSHLPSQQHHLYPCQHDQIRRGQLEIVWEEHPPKMRYLRYDILLTGFLMWRIFYTLLLYRVQYKQRIFPEQRDQYGLFLEFSINYSNAVRHERKRETF